MIRFQGAGKASAAPSGNEAELDYKSVCEQGNLALKKRKRVYEAYAKCSRLIVRIKTVCLKRIFLLLNFNRKSPIMPLFVNKEGYVSPGSFLNGTIKPTVTEKNKEAVHNNTHKNQCHSKGTSKVMLSSVSPSHQAEPCPMGQILILKSYLHMGIFPFPDPIFSADMDKLVICDVMMPPRLCQIKILEAIAASSASTKQNIRIPREVFIAAGAAIFIGDAKIEGQINVNRMFVLGNAEFKIGYGYGPFEIRDEFIDIDENEQHAMQACARRELNMDKIDQEKLDLAESTSNLGISPSKEKCEQLLSYISKTINPEH